jgi:hypothetical protein|tara:strand:+ start:141 stop:482 length:342 start_codon:yes stop_codon:yes gene_type:complete
MKLTKKSLKTLISEEIRRFSTILLEMPEGEQREQEEVEQPSPSQQIAPEGDEGEMAKRSLYHMSQQSQQLHDMLTDEENLEPWVLDKISKAAGALEEAFKAVTYDKGPGQGRG